jgi:hypothetical protein
MYYFDMTLKMYLHDSTGENIVTNDLKTASVVGVPSAGGWILSEPGNNLLPGVVIKAGVPLDQILNRL